MTNKERARQYAALFTKCGPKWRQAIPLDRDRVHRDGITLGGVRIILRDGRWEVQS